MKFYLAELKILTRSTLATWLNSIGVKVGEVRVIPDIEKTIIDTLKFIKKNL